MRTHSVLGLASAIIVSVLALTACTHQTSDFSPSPDNAAVTATPTGKAVESPTPVAPSLAAGIPTAKPSATDPAPGALKASVQITLATVDPATGDLLVGGFVSGVIEDGGDCEFTVTAQGGESVAIHKSGVANNGSTSCGSTTIAKSRLPAGPYTVVLRYVSDKGEAASEAVKVDAA